MNWADGLVENGSGLNGLWEWKWKGMTDYSRGFSAME